MKKIKYVGEYEGNMPTLGIFVKPGDVIEVEDTFEHVLFVLVKEDSPEMATVPDAPQAPKLKGDK